MDSLKKKGKFGPEAQKHAFEEAKKITLSLLTQEAKDLLQQLYNDVNLWLEWISSSGTAADHCTLPAPAKKIEVGSKVKIKSSATNYSTGQKIPDWVKANTYTVQQLGTGKALLKEIVSWVNISDLTLV